MEELKKSYKNYQNQQQQVQAVQPAPQPIVQPVWPAQVPHKHYMSPLILQQTQPTINVETSDNAAKSDDIDFSPQKDNEVIRKTDNRKRIPFSKEEDKKLTCLVGTEGNTNWEDVSAHLPDRSKKECKGRYVNHLSPNIQDKRFNNEDSQILVKAIGDLGPRKASIAVAKQTGRSEVNVRNQVFRLQHTSTKSIDKKSSQNTRENETPGLLTFAYANDKHKSLFIDEAKINKALFELDDNIENIKDEFIDEAKIKEMLSDLDDIGNEQNINNGFSTPSGH